MADIFDFYVYDDRSIQFAIAEPIMLEDKDVTQFRFRIPKVLNNIDMTDWEWWFIFVNAKKVKYTTQLTLTDDEDDPDNYSNATYTVGYGFSGYVGSVSFSIEALNVSGEDIVNEWHTRTYNTHVIDTLQGTRAVIPEPDGQAGTGLTEAMKQALLQIAQKVAYIDEHGQTYYNALYNALYPPADLVSISAVYTQSGTVYDTDSLDSLKADLVVTANYAGGTSETVPASNYTLLGTLTEGTSTITVSYAGLTDTFSVTVTHVEVGLSHYWNFKTGSLVDTIDGETTLAVGANTVIASGTGVTIDAKTDFITIPWASNAGLVRAKVKFGAINRTAYGNERLIGIKSGATSTPSVALRYSNTNGYWSNQSDVYATEITDANAFENKEIELVRSGNKISVLFNGQTVINEYSSGTGWQYWEVGGSNGSAFYTIVVESIKMYSV